MKPFFDLKKPYVFLTDYYALSLPEYHMHAHIHDSIEIMYITNGSCLIYCEEQEFSLHANEFILIAANTPHQLEITHGSPCSILNLEFRLQEKETSLSINAVLTNCHDILLLQEISESVLTACDLRSLGYALKDLISQLQRNEHNSEFLLELLFCRTILELSFCLTHSKKISGIAYVKKACKYIDEHFLDNLSIPEIADYVGINKSYLHSLFSQMLQCTITTYINQKRLEHAIFLLVNSTMCITDIAFASGYNSRQHFAYMFEKQYQISPLKYRQLHSRALVPDTGDFKHFI